MNKFNDRVPEIIKKYGKTITIPTKLLIDPTYNGSGSQNNRVSHSGVIFYGLIYDLIKKQNLEDEHGKYATITRAEICDIIGISNGESVTKMFEKLQKLNIMTIVSGKNGESSRYYLSKDFYL